MIGRKQTVGDKVHCWKGNSPEYDKTASNFIQLKKVIRWLRQEISLDAAIF